MKKLTRKLNYTFPGLRWSDRDGKIKGRPVEEIEHLTALSFTVENEGGGAFCVWAHGSLDRAVLTGNPVSVIFDLLREAREHWAAIEADKAAQREELVKRKLREARCDLHARFAGWEFDLKIATCPRTNEERHALTGVHQRLDHLGGLAFRIFWDDYNPGGAVPDAYFVEAAANWDESPWMVPTWRKQFISRDVCECVEGAIYFAATETKRRRREKAQAAD